MQKETPTQTAEPLKIIFNYNNVFYSFFYDDASSCIHRSREFAMNYVYSGEMVLDNGKEQIHVGKGECVFIPRDHHITMYKKACDEQLKNIPEENKEFYKEMIKDDMQFAKVVPFLLDNNTFKPGKEKKSYKEFFNK